MARPSRQHGQVTPRTPAELRIIRERGIRDFKAAVSQLEEKEKAPVVNKIPEENGTAPAVTTVLAVKGNSLEVTNTPAETGTTPEVISIPEEEMHDNE